MNYCRFENTLKDLIDCTDALHTVNNETSKTELKAVNVMYEECKMFVSLYDEKNISNISYNED